MQLPFSDEELHEAIEGMLEGKIKQYISGDGGDIELVDVKDGEVFVRLKGACVGCGSSGSTIKYVVEKELRRLIHPDLVVKQVTA